MPSPKRSAKARSPRIRPAASAVPTEKPSKPPAAGKTGRRHRRPIVPGDLLCMTSVLEPRITAAGEALVFVRKVVGEKNRPETSLWTVPTDGSASPSPLTAGTRDGQPRISPDDRRVAFVRSFPDKPSQIAVIERSGGEARIVTRLPEGSLKLLAWSPKGDRLIVAFRPTEADFTEAARKERERTGASEPPRVLDTRWHRLDGDGWFNAERFALYLVDLRSGRHTLLHDEERVGVPDIAWSPDGSRLAIATNRAPDALLKPWKDEILIHDLELEHSEPLVGLPIGPKTAVAWSPDGKRLAWAGRKGRDDIYSTENLELWTCTVPSIARAKGKSRRTDGASASDARSLTHQHDLCLLTATLSDTADPAFEPTIRWAPDSESLLVRVGHHGSGHLVSIALDGSAPRTLTPAGCDMVFGSLSRDGTLLAATRSTPTELPEAGVLRITRRGGNASAEWHPLTNFNASLLDELDLAVPKEHWVTAEDGHRVHLWVLEPPASVAKAAKTKRFPGILEVHGGPHTQYGQVFFHEFQLLAAQGYVVVYSNPRGSKGYGRDHCAAIRGNWGDRDWVDIQAVTRFMERHDAIDPKRLGIMGGSYGGYMTNWAIAHTDRFRAAITDRCVANLLSFCGNSDYPLLPDEYWPGTNYDRPERLWQASPIAHFKGVTTPTLIIHSEGDFRCNIEQAEQVHTALVLQGVPCRFVRYPMSTSHGMSRSGPADLRIHRLHEILAWWKRWLA
jgi:dipeptidyl aminopeptidase/acylaminoacyl peptidase